MTQPAVWEGVAVSEIPVPPFAGYADARRFHSLLQLHLSQLKRPGDPVGVHLLLLGMALHMHVALRDQSMTCRECAQPYPCRTLLRVALVSRFGVPWSPHRLAQLLSASDLWSSGPWRDDHRWSPGPWGDVVSEDRIAWSDDPRFEAVREPSGGWVVTATERGTTAVRARPADDPAMIEFLADHFGSGPYPGPDHIDPDWPTLVEPGARRAAGWWQDRKSVV